jgi:putative Holliday junction resolvase
VTSAADPAIVLAFDFGTRRIGVAVGNTLTRTAQPLTTIEAADDAARLSAIDKLVAQWQPKLLVVGVPVHADGTKHAMTRRAQRFSQQLANRFGLPVHAADERHTTQLAQSSLDAARAGRKGRAQRDQVAAQMILQGWFDDGGAASS